SNGCWFWNTTRRSAFLVVILQKAAVFASGTGSNFQAIINQKDLPCEICLLVCDMAEAPVIEKARQKGISIYLFDPKSYPSKQDYEKEILRELHALGIEWIFLAGYMRLIGSTLLNVFTGKILISIHRCYRIFQVLMLLVKHWKPVFQRQGLRCILLMKEWIQVRLLSRNLSQFYKEIRKKHLQSGFNESNIVCM